MTYGWAEPVQRNVSTQLLPLAQGAGPASEVVVDFQHKTLRVVVPTDTPPNVKQAVRTTVLTTPIAQTLHVHGWSFVVAPQHDRPYTSHVGWSQVARRPRRLKGLDGNVCVLLLGREEIDALRHALHLLEDRVVGARVVATFGMGGLPLLHWLSTPTSGAASAAAAALASAGRYHLLPGLNWSSTPREKDVFRTWLSGQLAIPGQILVFDTGREGNGIRQARDLAREAIEHCAPTQGASVAIVGLVDGPPRESEQYTVRGGNGVAIAVTVNYIRVPYLPTEDNGLLLGYDADRHTGVLHPVAGLLLYRIEETPAVVACAAKAINRLDARFTWLRGLVKRCGRHLARHAFVATSSGANTISDLVRGPRRPRGSRSHKEDLEWGTAAMLLAHAQATELEALENAIAVGFVAPRMLNTVISRHEREQGQLLSRRWGREQKRVVVIGA